MVSDEPNRSDDDVEWMSEAASRQEVELDPLRIRRIAAEKRSANRLRSYLIIGGVVAAALLAQITMQFWK